MQADDCYTAADTVEAMRQNDRIVVTFRPSEFFPLELAPGPLPGWKVLAGDDGAILYVHIARDAAAVAWLTAH